MNRILRQYRHSPSQKNYKNHKHYYAASSGKIDSLLCMGALYASIEQLPWDWMPRTGSTVLDSPPYGKWP